MTEAPTDATDRMLKVIYIMGYGRSGSTILDVLLNQHPDVLSGGEVAQLYRCVRAGETCACRVPIRECSFWRAVCAKHAAGSIDDLRRLASFQRSIQSLRNLPALLLARNRKGGGVGVAFAW